MNVGILAQNGEKNFSGVTKEIIGIVQELIKDNSVGNKYYFLGEEKNLPINLDTIDVISDIEKSVLLDYTLKAHKLDVVHSFIKPYVINHKLCGKVYTVNDLGPYVYEDMYGKFCKMLYDGPYKLCAQNADVVIAISESTKRDMIKYWGIPEEKIKVIYLGVYPTDMMEMKAEKVNNEKIAPGNYILSVSAININKNTHGLLEAFIRYKERNKDSDVKLVLTGSIRNAVKFNQILEKYPQYRDEIIYTGYVSDSQLLWLYKNAMVFAYPSFYEGFGLPILEAMTCGKAVITSNVTSMPEVGGDAVQYCNPYEIDSIVEAMEKVVNNPERRKELEKKSLVQAAKFSYKKAAKETLDVYRMFQ